MTQHLAQGGGHALTDAERIELRTNYAARVGRIPHLGLLLLDENDELRAFVQRIAWLDPNLGPMHVHSMVADAQRLLRGGRL